MTPTTVAPTATTTSAIEKTCAPWLCVDQSLLLFVDQSLELLGEFCVELLESFEEPCELCDESPDDFEESLDPFEEFESFEFDESLDVEPELPCPEARAGRVPAETRSVERASVRTSVAGR